MDKPFKKIAAATDFHFGRKNGSAEALQDNLDFIDWFIEQAKSEGITECILLGDYFDNRFQLQVASLDAGLEGFKRLSEAFEKVYSISGNHDLVYRASREITSLEFSKFVPNVIPVFDPMVIGEGTNSFTLLPWLTQDDKSFVKNIRSRYVFGHLELNGGWLMNAKAVVPDRDDALHGDDFDGVEYVFSGHYHFRQRKENVIYIGNIFPFDFADTWDEERGMMILEWGGEPEFRAWPKQPLFRNFRLSEVIDDPDKYLCDRLTARCHVDIDMPHEEQLGLRDDLVKRYNMRKFELVPMEKTSISDQTMKRVEMKSIDQMVMEGLDSVDSNALDKELLKEIYEETEA